MKFFCRGGLEWPGRAVMRFGHLRVGFELSDEQIVGVRLPPGEKDVKREQGNQRNNRHIVRRGNDFPELSPIHGYFRASLISDSRITDAGPEMPPSLRTRQKCTTIKINAMMGMPMQCQM